jgi:uncharacterized protein (UPF0210 family)
MKVRSITCFFDPSSPAGARQPARLAEFVQTASASFQQAGYEVETVRLATTPFPLQLKSFEKQAAVELAQSMEAQASACNFTYLSLGPAMPFAPDSYSLIPAMLAATKNTFFSGIIAAPHGGLSMPAILACGQVIADSASLEPNGFANLRFTALANVPSGVPFFPASYHKGGRPAFALALEAADLVEEAFKAEGELLPALEHLRASLNEHAAALERVAAELTANQHISYRGLDFSPAPFPQPGCSLAGGMEAAGVSIGKSGAVAAAALLTQVLDEGKWKKTGFNGMMLPVLEDAVLAQRSSQGVLSIQDLLLYSAVCGTGLDTVPLPGSATADQLSAVLLDVAALSLRLNKPLTARLMPIPGKQAGDPTAFDFAYFANGGVMALNAEPLSAPIATAGSIPLHPHRRLLRQK